MDKGKKQTMDWVEAGAMVRRCGDRDRRKERQEAQAARDYSHEVDMEALTARYYRAVELLKAAETAADSGQEVDMEVLTARRYRVLQTADGLRIAQVSSQ